MRTILSAASGVMKQDDIFRSMTMSALVEDYSLESFPASATRGRQRGVVGRCVMDVSHTGIRVVVL